MNSPVGGGRGAQLGVRHGGVDVHAHLLAPVPAERALGAASARAPRRGGDEVARVSVHEAGLVLVIGGVSPRVNVSGVLDAVLRSPCLM